jgi:single-stranded-DNA-specific exonuclease
LPDFRAAFEAVARELLTAEDLAQTIDVDGELEAGELTCELAQALREHVWGQGFPEPRFSGRFRVESQRVVGEKHLKLALSCGGQRFYGIRFGNADAVPDDVRIVYRLDVNEYQGASSLQLIVEHVG